MFRLALARSIVPLISAAIPTPEPPPETSMSTSGRSFLYSSAQTCARLTMVSEPLFWMVTGAPAPATPPPEPPGLQPGSKASASAPAATASRGKQKEREVGCMR
jgi:hypothetical protein